MKLLLSAAALFFLFYTAQAQNVGIGTGSPVHKVHIAGLDAGSIYTSLAIENPATNAGSSVFLKTSGFSSYFQRLGSSAGGSIGGVNASNLTQLGTPKGALMLTVENAASLYFVSRNLLRMEIDSNGNTGINVATAPSLKFHVKINGLNGYSPFDAISTAAIYGENGNGLTGSGVLGFSNAPRSGNYNYAGITGINFQSGTDRFGVIGKSSGTSAAAAPSAGVGGFGDYGVLGQGQNATGAGVLAQSTGGNTALEVNNGFIKVSGTNKTAFIHTATAGNTSAHVTSLSYLNEDPSDIIIITPNFNPPGGGVGIYNNHPLGVYWNGSTWSIFNQDFAAIDAGTAFNVLVIKQ